MNREGIIAKCNSLLSYDKAIIDAQRSNNYEPILWICIVLRYNKRKPFELLISLCKNIVNFQGLIYASIILRYCNEVNVEFENGTELHTYIMSIIPEDMRHDMLCLLLNKGLRVEGNEDSKDIKYKLMLNLDLNGQRPDLFDAIRFHWTKDINNLINSSNLSSTDSCLYHLAINCLNLTAFEALIDSGKVAPDYYVINLLLSLISCERHVLKDQMLGMIMSCEKTCIHLPAISLAVAEHYDMERKFKKSKIDSCNSIEDNAIDHHDKFPYWRLDEASKDNKEIYKEAIATKRSFMRRLGIPVIRNEVIYDVDLKMKRDVASMLRIGLLCGIQKEVYSTYPKENLTIIARYMLNNKKDSKVDLRLIRDELRFVTFSSIVMDAIRKNPEKIETLIYMLSKA